MYPDTDKGYYLEYSGEEEYAYIAPKVQKYRTSNPIHKT